MRTLTQHLYRGGGSTKLLPDIHPLLTDATVRVRRGQMVMLTAPSGGGKSLLALWYVIKRRPGKVLYFSLDTSLSDMSNRAAGMMAGLPVADIEDALENGADEWVNDIISELNEDIRWCVNARDIRDVDEELEAYREVFGEDPDLVVIDVLLNLDASEEWQGMMRSVAELHALAHERDVTVFVLHHNSDKRADQSLPAPKSDALMKVSQYPELILSLALDPSTDVMRVAAVKNRSGKGYPDASTYVTLPIDLESMRIFDTEEEWLAFRKRKEWT